MKKGEIKRKRSVFVQNKEFGYSRKDVILIGVVLIGLGVGSYYGLQFGAGMDPIMAGNFVQLIFVLLLSFGWVGSYLFRVATKEMTYVKQLKDYEDAVMEKRLEEMTQDQIEELAGSDENYLSENYQAKKKPQE